MAQVAAKMSTAVPYDTLQPFQDHFHPTVPKYDEGPKGSSLLDERRTGSPMSAISVIPLKEQVSYLSSFAYKLHSFLQVNCTRGSRLLGLLPPQALRPESDRPQQMYQVYMLEHTLRSFPLLILLPAYLDLAPRTCYPY